MGLIITGSCSVKLAWQKTVCSQSKEKVAKTSSKNRYSPINIKPSCKQFALNLEQIGTNPSRQSLGLILHHSKSSTRQRSLYFKKMLQDIRKISVLACCLSNAT